MKAFKIAINVAGAISAGAYTAGVLDFLTEALDAWYEAKSRNELVPNHNVAIEAFSGASAGGMCAAISAIMLQYEFEHISDTRTLGHHIPRPEHVQKSFDQRTRRLLQTSVYNRRPVTQIGTSTHSDSTGG